MFCHSTPGPRTLSSVPLGQDSVFSTRGPRGTDVISTPGPRTLSSVPLGQELCHQYPCWPRGTEDFVLGPGTEDRALGPGVLNSVLIRVLDPGLLKTDLLAQGY